MRKNHSAFLAIFIQFQKNILHNPNMYSLFFLFASYICKIILLYLILHRQKE